jgi:Uncharacterized protein conserved in bacteria (DUF2330)
MAPRAAFALVLAVLLFIAAPQSSLAPACCPVPTTTGKAVVNADQTVIIVWDAASKTEHFIRQASFKSEADDFGFLVPTPTEPDLQESGNEAFPFLRKLTEPARVKEARPSPGGCSEEPRPRQIPQVHVLAEKSVAGFHAVVLEAKSADSLAGWLKEHSYAFSPEVEAWAKPYVQSGWKITALKVAKDSQSEGRTVNASALRMSFKTDRPLFPYREPALNASAKGLASDQRLLRIYFVGEARYRGEFRPRESWLAHVAYSNRLSPEDRQKLVGLLKIPESTVPAKCWLTEFEDNWLYRWYPADVTFLRDSNQETFFRDPIIEYVSSPWPSDPTVYALVSLVVVRPLLKRSRRSRASVLN